MLQITPQMRILVAVEAVHGRKGIDSLVQLCREKLDTDPFSGYLFVFRSRSATSIRILTYDGQGFWLAQKRLSKGRFVWWPEASEPAKPLADGGRGCFASACGADVAARRSAEVNPGGKQLKGLASKKSRFILLEAWLEWQRPTTDTEAGRSLRPTLSI